MGNVIDSRLKVRAWDRTSKEMLYISSMDVASGTIYCPKHADGTVGSSYSLNHEGQTAWKDTNNLVFMQCTGLADLNGNDIFEGDIVSFNTVGGATMGEVKRDHDGRFYVYRKLLDDRFYFYEDDYPVSPFVVFDNIFERKEVKD